MRVMAQMAMVMNLDKCIGCHTCSVTCKQAWTNRAGTEYVWFNNVETRPGQGYPRRYEDQETWKGGWELGRRGNLKLKSGGRVQPAARHLRQPRAAGAEGLLRAVDLRLPDAGGGAAGRRLPRGAAEVAHHRPGHQGHLVGQLGRQPRRRERDGPPRPHRRAGPSRVRGQGPLRARADLHVLPAADLRALPQPVVHGVLPLGGDLQARRGRHRPGRPGPVPWLAAVHHRLPVQEDLLQPQDRQGREVHVLLPTDRGGPADGLLGDLRRAAALPRPLPVRRRPRHAGGGHTGPRRPLRGAAGPHARPRRPRRGGAGPSGRHPRRLDGGGPALTGLRARQALPRRPAAAPGVPHHADGLVRPTALPDRRRARRRRGTTPRTGRTSSARSTPSASPSSTSPSSSPPGAPTS